jgi:hypothetical protein
MMQTYFTVNEHRTTTTTTTATKKIEHSNNYNSSNLELPPIVAHKHTDPYVVQPFTDSATPV